MTTREPTTRAVEDCTGSLKAPYRSRARKEPAITGAIELAFRRGYQAGWEDRDAALKRTKKRHA